MRNLTKLEINLPTGGNTCAIVLTTAVISSFLTLVLIGSSSRRYCGWQAYIFNDTFFDYQWVCDK
jgi:hypothetical protein